MSNLLKVERHSNDFWRNPFSLVVEGCQENCRRLFESRSTKREKLELSSPDKNAESQKRSEPVLDVLLRILFLAVWFPDDVLVLFAKANSQKVLRAAELPYDRI